MLHAKIAIDSNTLFAGYGTMHLISQRSQDDTVLLVIEMRDLFSLEIAEEVIPNMTPHAMVVTAKGSSAQPVTEDHLFVIEVVVHLGETLRSQKDYLHAKAQQLAKLMENYLDLKGATAHG